MLPYDRGMVEQDKKLPRVNFFTYKPSSGDRLFDGVARFAGYLSFSLVFLVLIFLGWASKSTFIEQGTGFFTGSNWNGPENVFQILPMFVGSFVLVFLALIISIPSSIAMAYFIEFMAPRKVAGVATNLIDLLAALPSIIIALWGVAVFTPIAAGWGELLNGHFGFIPFFENNTGNFYRSPFIGGWILAIMMIPIITSISREVISKVDKELVSAAFALGGTSFSTMRRVILPTAKGGILGGILLGMGRGLGETVAILYTINLIFEVNIVHVLENKGGAIAPMIAAFYGNAEGGTLSALLAAGVVLFFATLLINMLSTVIVQRSIKKMAS